MNWNCLQQVNWCTCGIIFLKRRYEFARGGGLVSGGQPSDGTAEESSESMMCMQCSAHPAPPEEMTGLAVLRHTSDNALQAPSDEGFSLLLCRVSLRNQPLALLVGLPATEVSETFTFCCTSTCVRCAPTTNFCGQHQTPA